MFWYNNIYNIQISISNYFLLVLLQVQLVVEGELKKRQQLSDDVDRIGQWIEKTLKDTQDRVSGTVDLEDDFIEVR